MRPLGTVLLGVCAFAFSAEEKPAARAELPQDIPGLIEYMARSDVAGKEASERLGKLGAPAVEPLIAALKHKEPRVRYWGAAALCQIGDERAYKPLLQTLRSDPNPLVRSTILWQLQKFKKDEVYDLAFEYLNDPDKMVRFWAMRVLVNGNRTDKLPMILRLTRDKDAAVRHDALVAAVELGGNTQLELIRKMAASDSDPEVRAGALRCLTLLPEKTAEILAIMINSLQDPDPNVQTVAATLLAKGTNQSFGFDPSRPPERKAVAKWQKWYETNKANLKWDNQKRRFVLPNEPPEEKKEEKAAEPKAPAERPPAPGK